MIKPPQLASESKCASDLLERGQCNIHAVFTSSLLPSPITATLPRIFNPFTLAGDVGSITCVTYLAIYESPHCTRLQQLMTVLQDTAYFEYDHNAAK